MCNPLLKDPNGKLWALGVTDNGLLTTSSTTTKLAIFKGSTLIAGGAYWQLAVDLSGLLNTTSVAPTINGLPFIALTSPTGLTWQLTSDISGILSTTFSNTHVNDIVPMQPDVVMSAWPTDYGVVCVTCGNASVTVSADFSCWCCTCNSFVLPDDTNILVFLDE